CQQYSNWKTF
nr:immunoglobulin light chain junction region [Macaca mulatta]MOV61704.1 immunoglobulin light chain junction region [Macaca mulatta]MOV62155.1 immunoglobulin light chain junction region [Macaca mulatta]MOV62708.1 immunoglobulin light chain junction region [Macaca mulatta]MOV63042.1 immunoglobulin light chain junction region [Macaca mulatta]